ncbi:MAG: sugar phosphate isomerase/epimerase [Planctomycetia bacterium]|nr:sugar phosphate isomerase/epimerase [Planctomycetia bacterium]
MTSHPLRRRGFLATLGLLACAGRGPSGAAADAPPRRGIGLGFDNFAVRGMQWNARQLIDHAVVLGCDSVFITDFGPLEDRHDDRSLGDLRRYGEDRGVAIQIGSWSICPTSTQFRKDWGTAGEHLALGIRMAKAVGSPAFRVILGNQADRLTPGGIEARIADTVEVLRSQRSRAIDAGVKIAVENHAGDMQSRELLGLVEAAGPEFVGVNFDSGNACWALEDPLDALARLAPHVLTTSLRDTMVWESDGGITTQWTAMGEGCVDLPAFFATFAERCPGVTVHVETISGFPRTFPVGDRGFWKAYPDARAEDLAGLLALARRGRPIEAFTPPAGADRSAAERDYQLDQLARSIRHCRDALGLGLR